MTMCRFALYDPAQPSPGGSYWAWLAEGLDVARLDKLYYDAASGNRPPDPNRLLPDDVWGGIAELGDDIVGVYRYFDGGRDLHGRPGRFVILATLLDSRDVRGRDLSVIFRSETARWAAQRAPMTCPLPAPPSLEEPIELPPVIVDDDLTQERFEFVGHDALSRAGRVFGSLPSGMGWRCMIRGASDCVSQSSIYRNNPTSPPSADAGDSGPTGTRPQETGDGPQSSHGRAGEVASEQDAFSSPGFQTLLAHLTGVGKALRGEQHPWLPRLLPLLLVLLAVSAWLRLVQPVPATMPLRTAEMRNQPDPRSHAFPTRTDVDPPYPGRHSKSDGQSTGRRLERVLRELGQQRQTVTPAPKVVMNTPAAPTEITSGWSSGIGWRILHVLVVIAVVAAIARWRPRRNRQGPEETPGRFRH
jgi:hypothetical protein